MVKKRPCIFREGSEGTSIPAGKQCKFNDGVSRLELAIIKFTYQAFRIKYFLVFTPRSHNVDSVSIRKSFIYCYLTSSITNWANSRNELLHEPEIDLSTGSCQNIRCSPRFSSNLNTNFLFGHGRRPTLLIKSRQVTMLTNSSHTYHYAIFS